MSLSPGNKSGDSFNFHLQNSIARWEPSFKDHCFLLVHVCSFEDFTVLNYESHKFKSLIKESLLVTKDKPLLNKQVKSLKLEQQVAYWVKVL